MTINILTELKVLDNSGALEAICIKSYKRGRSLGHVIPVLVTKTRPDSKVKSGKIYHGLIVWSVANRGPFNAVILLRGKSQFIGTRLRYPIPRALRSKITLWPLGPSWI